MLIDEKEERQKLRDNTDELLRTAKSIEGSLNGLMGVKAMMTTSAESAMVRKHFQARMREYLTDDEIYQALLPSFAVGCRRLTPGDPYMKAVQQPNVTVHRAALAKVDGNTLIGSNGERVEVDTLICATGFDLNYTPKYPVKGRNGGTYIDG